MSLVFTTITQLAADLGPDDDYPALGTLRPGFDDVRGRDEERASAAPYHRQSSYSRATAPAELPAAVLDNGILRATFLPSLGGRLWSLIDLRTGRETLHRPDALRFGNLAVRDAWFAGGVEWNLGVRGHWGLTAAPVFAGRAGADGDVLRMWEWERMLGLVWRVEASLPAGAEALIVRPSVTNPGPDDAPLYWWSNIAVPQTDGSRVLVEATTATRFGYAHVPETVGFPEHDGVRSEHPARAAEAADWFFDLAPDRTPWIASVEADGSGLAQLSTPELRGRKLFVWGENRGGRRWQEWLGGSYLEIQAGVERTQFDYGVLPPGARIGWTEAYAPLPAHPSRGESAEWEAAVAATAAVVSRIAPMLERPAEAGPASVELTALGWGALEVAAGHLDPDLATPFPPETLGAAQAPWIRLVETGELPPATAPAVRGARWLARAEAASGDPAQFGLLLLAAGRTAEAEAALRSAPESATTLRALAVLATAAANPEAAAGAAVAAAGADPRSDQLLREAVAACLEAGDSRRALDLIDAAAPGTRDDARLRLLEARAALGSGDLARARRVIDEHPVPANLREGDATLDALWVEWCRVTGTTDELPAAWDFRMRVDAPET